MCALLALSFVFFCISAHGMIIKCLPAKKLNAGMDKSIEESYIRAIDSCSRYFINDYTAINIINEEIQAYFYGQKNLDDVIAIINNRVSLLQDERG